MNWDTSEWDLTNWAWEDGWSELELCEPTKLGMVLFPQKRNLTSAASLCRKMKAEMTETASKEMIDLQADTIMNYTGGLAGE